MLAKSSPIYPHRLNKDGSYTSICPQCLSKVARTNTEAELAAHDNIHKCNPSVLAERSFVEPPHLPLHNRCEGNFSFWYH
jgi:hypothetical protein